MPDSEQIAVRMIRSLTDISAGDWDACANPGGDIPFNPFSSHAFLSALEDSGSAVDETGWAAHHLVAEDSARSIIGVMPLYLKNHSQGEYVFDYGWADAFERAGGQYYPKFQISIPFTPATGRRLLVRPGFPGVETGLASAAMKIASDNQVSSIHWTFLPKDQQNLLSGIGCLARQDQQFHWKNRDYETFDDFLGQLQSRKRKQIKRERAKAIKNGVEISVLTGAGLTEDIWDAFYEFYIDTGGRKWGTPYLTRSFFSMLSERMADDVAVVMCKREGRWIAGALNLIGSDTLFGRNWGAIEHHECLHFEACYYQAIEFAILRGLKFVEAGAQGPHKLARGYEPTLTYSSHWIANPDFRNAVEHFLNQERRAVEQDAAYLDGHTPFRKGD